MLDKSIPHIGVLMDKYDTLIYPKYELPAGYAFCNYQNGYEHFWSALQFSVEQTDSLEEAEEIFRNEFQSKPDDMLKRCIFIKDYEGNIVATASLWFGYHFGRELQRIHWVAVSQRHQRKGLAKALLTKLFELYNELGYSEYIYLTSQTWSYKALNIYMEFGFKPYLGKKPINWESVNLTSGKFEPWDFDEKKHEAWKMILEKISTYTT